MSDTGSQDSVGPPLKGWTVVTQSGDVETSSDDGGSTSSSSDFVDLGTKVVRYHHKDKSRSTSLSSPPRDSTHSAPEGAEAAESSDELAPPAGPSRSSSTDESEFEALEAEKEPSEGGEEAAVDGEVTIATDEAVPAEDNVSDTPSVEVITQDDLDLARSDVEADGLDPKVPEEAHDSESASSVEVITQDDLDLARSDMVATDDLEAGAEAEADTGAVHDGIESASETVTEMIAVPVMTELPPSGALNLRRRHLSNSDSSDSSDFVRLDPSLAEELPRALHDVMNSSSQSGSSISDNFRFVQPLHRGPNPYREDDEESIPPEDVDDRCESDISGVAEDESDLSCMSYSLGDVPIDAGNVRRNCRHRPNSTLNGLLTLLTVITVFMAVGIGIGHYIGSQREAWLRSEQVVQMKSLQDDYLMCLREQERLEEEALDPIMERNKWEAVTEIWKKKYEELLVEKVELEQQIKMLEVKHHGSLVSVHEDLSAMEQDLEELETQRLESERERSVLQAQYDESSVKQELLQQQKIRLQQEKFVVQEQLKSVEEDKVRLELQLKQMTEATTAAESEWTAEQADWQTELDRKSDQNEALKQQLNQLQQENSDLQAEVVKLRYSPHVEEVRSNQQVKEERLKHHVNELANENADLKVTVGKMRYKADETESEAAPSIVTRTDDEMDKLKERLTEVNDALAREKARARLWETMFVADRVNQENASLGFDGEAKPTPPSLSLCLSLLLPSINVTELMQKIGVNLPLESVVSGMGGHAEFLRNLTHDIEFTEMLKRRWEEFRHYAEHPQVQNFVDEAVQVYQDMQRSMTQRWEDFTQREEVKAAGTKVTEFKDAVVETVKGLHDNEKFRHVVDKTKESVAELTDRLADTWKKVKNLSNDFLDKHKDTIESVQGTVSHIGEKVAKSVDKMHRKLRKHGAHWFKSDQNNNEYAYQDHHSNSHARTRRREYGPGDGLHVNPESANQKPQFEDKPNHKQKQSNHEQNYEEFWYSSGFDPDDLLHDGFFEGNQREWRKHQKQLKKLHGRIQKLNEELFYSMDDDDIEDIYDDLEDFEDDIEDDLEPGRLQTWLTCQLRWWKSRFQRKHRSEDLIRGCGRQLVRWQLRALCKPWRCSRKKCGKKGGGRGGEGDAAQSDLCHLILQTADSSHSHVASHVTQGPQCKKGNKHQHSSSCHQHHDQHHGNNRHHHHGYDRHHGNKHHHHHGHEHRHHHHGHDNRHHYHHGNKRHNASNGQKGDARPEVDEKTSRDATVNDTYWEELVSEAYADWFWRRAQDRENQRLEQHVDPTWYFRYMEDRETHRGDPSWIFQRAAERDVERSKDWYIRRMQERDYYHPAAASGGENSGENKWGMD